MVNILGKHGAIEFPEPLLQTYQPVFDEKQLLRKIWRMNDIFEKFIKFLTIISIQLFIRNESEGKDY